MPPKWVKNSEPEDEQVLCRLDLKLKISATTPRMQKEKLVLHCLTQHNMCALRSAVQNCKDAMAVFHMEYSLTISQ